MRIGYIWGRAIPSRDTDTQQVLSTVDALARAGADVELLVSAPAAARNAPARARFERAVRTFYAVDGPFRLVPLRGLPASRLELQRPLHGALALAHARARGYDVVYTRSRSVTLAAVACAQPVVFETYRLLRAHSPRVARLLARAARSPHLLGVVTHSALAAASLAGAGVPESKLATIHNGFDPAALTPRRSREQARAALGLPHEPWMVTYTGHVRPDKGIAALLAVAAATPELAYRLLGGDADAIGALRATVLARGLRNVQVCGWVPARELGAHLFASDALIIPPSAAPLERFGRTVLPMKLFSYLAAGRPIVAPDTRDLRELLVDDLNAVLVPSDDPATCAAALRALRADPARAARLAEEARTGSERFSWLARGQRVIAQLAAWQADARALSARSRGTRSRPSAAVRPA